MGRLSLALALLLHLVAGIAFAQDRNPAPLETRAAIHPGFARLVFAAPPGGKPIPFTANSDETELTLRFAAPVAAKLDRVEALLRPYLTEMALSGDGMMLTAKLVRPVTLHQAADGSSVLYLDLADKSTAKPTSIGDLVGQAASQPPVATKPPAPAQPIVAPAKPAPAVAIRIGVHDQADRLIFDWRGKVEATTDEADGRGRIRFDQPARFDLPRLSAALPAALKPVEADESSLSFSLPAGRHLQVGHDGNRIALDILPAPQKIAPAAPAPPPAAKAPAPAPPPAAQAPGPEPAAQPAATLPPAPPPATPAAAESTVPVTGTLGHAADQQGAPSLQIHYALIDDGVSLRFDWSVPTAAAVFRRGNAIWIVFDQAQKLDFADFQSENWPVVTAIAQVPSRSGTVIRLSAWAGFNPVVRRAGNSWIADIKSRSQRPEAPVEASVHDENGNASLIYAVSEPAGPISMTDPDAGDILVAVPLPQLGQGVEQTSDYPDFRTLATAQGLVFRPVADQLVIRSKPAQVEIAAPGGLSLSSVADRQALRRAVNQPASLFKLADWHGPANLDFTAAKQALQDAIVAAPEPQRPNARLDLAKFYFANGMAAECLGILDAIEHDTPTLGEEPLIRALRGAAEVITERLDAAHADLGGRDLDDREDAALWRAVLAAKQGDSAAAGTAWTQGKSALPNYPPVLRRRIGLPMAEALFRAGQRDDADALAASVLGDGPSRGEYDLGTVLQGRIAGERGDRKKAMALWSEVALSPAADLGRAQARLALALTRYGQGDLSRPDAIAALEQLRFVWRGDDFEAVVMRKLADLHIEDQDYNSAFEILRSLIRNYPDTKLAREAADQMQKYFVDLFTGPNADTVPPLRALAFYEDFKELTPAGAAGDAVIRKLADRLVSVDLLDRAAALLETQVKTRLSGAEQARVAAQLALVRLLDHKPQDAIAALDIPVVAELPPELLHQRAELKARAEAELGQNDEALGTLTDDDSGDADRLRADIYWRTHNWSAVAGLLQKSLKDPGTDGSVEPDTAGAIINVATAMVLGNDRDGLEQLRQRYAAAMDKTQFKEDFRMLAGAQAGTGKFKTLADKVAQLGDLQSFMTAYRQRLNQDKLSAIN